MYLGLDLRGGVHFLLQVDLQAALTKRAENIAAEVRGLLREKTIRHGGVARDGQVLRIRFRDAETRAYRDLLFAGGAWLTAAIADGDTAMSVRL